MTRLAPFVPLLGLLIGCRIGFDAVDPALAPDGGALDGPAACVAESTTCAGASVRVCSGAKAMPVDEPCAWGCVSASRAHCGKLVPAGSVTKGDLTPTTPALADVTLSDPTTWMFSSGVIEASALAPVRAGGDGILGGISVTTHPGVTVFHVHSLHIVGALRLMGDRPIAIVADAEIVIDNVIDLRGACTSDITGGPGGASGGTGQATSGHSATSSDSGGGGGGNGGHGGTAEAAAGGAAMADVPFVLTGGGGGGRGDESSGFRGAGGGGGGAVQLISNTSIAIGASGGINAGGCGGWGGQLEAGGGGGGAGGTILLEAPAIEIAGKLAVNGGAGAGENQPNHAGDGTLDREAATGAGGGNGGFASAPHGAAATISGGGGGGAAGRIRLETTAGAVSILGGASLSPSLDDQTTAAALPAVVE